MLITTSTFPYQHGDGQARFVLDLATALSSHGDVTVLAPHAPSAARREIIGAVQVGRFGYFLPRSLQRLGYGAGMRHNIEESWLARIQIPFFLIAQTFATAWVVLIRRPSVINAHWLVPQGLTSALVARVFRVPLVLHVHAADVYFLRRFKVGGGVARFVVRSSRAVLADGSHVRDALEELLGFESGARLRPMGVWQSVFSEPQDLVDTGDVPDRFVVFVGRLVEKKGVEYLIRSMSQVREAVPDVELVIIGHGPLLGDLMNLAQDQGVAEAVHFVGSQGHDEVAGMLRQAEVACVPSIIDSKGETDGMPTVVLEAMAAGVRVVGSAVNGIPDVLSDAENGWLVQPADEQSLAKGIIAALTDPTGDAIAAAGARTALQHDWEAVAHEYWRVLEEAAVG